MLFPDRFFFARVLDAGFFGWNIAAASFKEIHQQ
jgi:hypothetical protein